MNRMLFTAAAALTMAVSSQAMAASYVLDSLTDGRFFDAADMASGGAFQTSTDVVGGLTRTVSFSTTFTDPADTTPGAWAYLGDPDNAFLDITNDVGVKAAVEIHYDLSSLFGSLTGSKAISFTVIAGPSASLVPTKISVKQNGSLLGSWIAAQAIPGPGVLSETSSFAMNALTGSDDLAFYVDGPDGYDLTVNQFSINDVAPVPEPGEWVMLVAGMGVVGAAASRRRTLTSI